MKTLEVVIVGTAPYILSKMRPIGGGFPRDPQRQ
jgi:hypothetical protein